MGFLAGKRALIVGVASERSIAWGIAQAMAREGASLAFTYQTERLGERVRDMAADEGSSICLPLDVASDDEIIRMYEALEPAGAAWMPSCTRSPSRRGTSWPAATWTPSPGRDSRSPTTSAATALRPWPSTGAGCSRRRSALLTLTYLGAVRAIPNYNVMGPAKASLEANVRFMAAELGASGVRVNGISAGPIKTLAAAGIGGFRSMLQHVASQTPIRRNVTIEDVGNAAAFLCSDLAAGITGEILYVDGGYSQVGMSLQSWRD